MSSLGRLLRLLLGAFLLLQTPAPAAPAQTPPVPAGKHNLHRRHPVAGVRFARPVKGRYLCLEAPGSLDGKPFAAVAGLDALDARGAVTSKSSWKIPRVSSEETTAESAEAGNVLDGQPATFWRTEYGHANPGYPHRLVVDLGERTTSGGIRYLPRGGNPGDPARTKDYRVYVSEQPFGLTPAP